MKRISIFVLLLCVLVFTATAGAADGENTTITNGGTIDLTNDLEISQVQTITQDTTIKSSTNKTIKIKINNGITVTGGTLTLGEGLNIVTEGITEEAEVIKVTGNSTKLVIAGANIKTNNSKGPNASIFGHSGATIEVTSGNLEASSGSMVGVRNGTLNISGGTIKSTAGATVFVIGNTDNSSYGSGTAQGTITGGTIEAGTQAIAVTNEGKDSTITISGNPNIKATSGWIATWHNGVQNNKAHLIINGGTFETKFALTYAGTITFGNGTFNIEHIRAATNGYEGEVIINGGTFTNEGLDLRSQDTTNSKQGTLTVNAGIFKIGTKIKTSADLLAFVPEDKKTTTTIVEHDGYFYVNTAIPTDPTPAPTPAPTPTPTTEKIEATVSGGELEYEIASGQTATVDEVLGKLSDAQLAQVKELPVNDQITEVSNESLKKLTNLQSLDLSNATNLTKTSLDLDGVKVETIMMSKDTKVTELKLSASSDVKAIEAAGTGNLKSIDLAGNKNIETVNVANTSVDKVDASGCSKLETLNTKGAKLTELKVDGCVALADLDCSANDGEQGEIQNLDLSTCTNLEKLKVSGNRLLFLDLSKQTKLKRSETSLGRQNSKKAYQRSREFDLMEFILSFLDSLLSDNTTQAKTIAGNITSVVEVDDSGNEIQSAEYDAATGVANFAKTPTKNVKYIYDTKAAFSAGVASVMLADDSSNMDVTLSGGTDGEVKDTSTGSSGGGCSAIKSDELGLKSVLMLLAFFALAFMKIKRA